jgi:hypothetical protein
MRSFSSAEYCLRVAPRMSARTTACGSRISVSSLLLDGYDEPDILLSSTRYYVSWVLISDTAKHDRFTRLMYAKVFIRKYGTQLRRSHFAIVTLEKDRLAFHEGCDQLIDLRTIWSSGFYPAVNNRTKLRGA